MTALRNAKSPARMPVPAEPSSNQSGKDQEMNTHSDTTPPSGTATVRLVANKELSPPEHEHSAAVENAAMWLSEQNPAPHPVVPILRSRFELTAVQACEACAIANQFRTNRKAFG